MRNKGENDIYYEINSKKKRKAIKAYIKKNMKDAGKFVKFCYVLEKLLKISAVVLGIANVLNVVLVSKDSLELVFLIMTFGFPFLFSYIPATVLLYVARDYFPREHEVLVIEEDGIAYRYSRVDATIGFKVKFCDITDIVVDETTKVVDIHGNISVEYFNGSEFEESDKEKIFDFIDAYDENVVELIRKAVSDAKENKR